MTATDAVLDELTGPGGRYEIAREDVLGVETQVYRERMRTLRELVAGARRAPTSTSWSKAMHPKTD